VYIAFHLFACAACIALVDEMNWKIGNVDDKSTLQVGSFRIDSSGNQRLHEVSTFLPCKMEFQLLVLKGFTSHLPLSQFCQLDERLKLKIN